MAPRAGFLAPLLRAPEAASITLARTGQPVATTVEGAFDSGARRRGLLGRAGLPPGHCLVIAPSGAIHTFGMAFAIDVLFLGRDGTVLKSYERLPPRRLAACWRAFAVAELPSGTISGAGIERGDRLVLGVATMVRAQ